MSSQTCSDVPPTNEEQQKNLVPDVILSDTTSEGEEPEMDVSDDGFGSARMKVYVCFYRRT